MAKKSSLFVATTDTPRNAYVRWMDPYRDSAIARGFKEAADAVVDHAAAQSRHPDQYLFPIGFLYRHCLELKLKRLCKLGEDLTSLQVPSGILRSHSLTGLWLHLRPMIEKVWPSGDPRELDSVNAVLREFQEVDPTSQGFRYDVDTQGQENLRGLPESITLDHLREVIDRTFALLDGCEAGFEECLSAMRGTQR